MPLSQAVAALGATPGPVPADVRATARAWREAWDALEESWTQLCLDAEEILKALKGEDTAKATTEATNEDPAKATTTGLARDLQDETSPHWGTAGDSLVAAAVSSPLAVAASDAPVAAATKVREEAVVATRQAGAATTRGQRVKEVQGLLGCLINGCNEACHWVSMDLHDWLRDIETTQEETDKLSPDDLEDLLAEAAELEQLWEAGTRLATRHLLGTLRDIQRLLSSPCGGSGGPGGPGGRAVAEWCQKAIKDIPRLLGGQ